VQPRYNAWSLVARGVLSRPAARQFVPPSPRRIAEGAVEDGVTVQWRRKL
jgi:hypothetical protein